MAWTIEALGTNVVQNGGNITLVEPSGAASGDLLVACIAWKDTAAFTKPSAEWTLIRTLSNGDTDAIGGVASGGMWYCIRGASAPSYVFTRTNGDVAMGQVISWKQSAGTPALDTSSILQVGSDTVNIVGTTITTAEGGELLVAMVAHGDAALTVTFDSVTNPGTASTTTVAVTTEPASNTWYERADTKTTTGADTGLFIADAIMTTAGATGAHSAVADVSSNQVVIVAAFKTTVTPLSKSIDGSTDILSVSENVTAFAKNIAASVFDNARMSESTTALARCLVSSISDTVGTSELLTLSSLGRTDVVDSVNVSESVEAKPLGKIDIYDSVSISENTALTSLGRASVYDTATVAETLLTRLNPVSVLVYDSIASSEFLTLTSLGRAEVADQTNVSEGMAYEAGSEAVVSSNIYDSVSVSESVTTQAPYLVVSISDTVISDENVTTALLLSVLVYDSVSAEDLAEKMLMLKKELADQITVSEDLNLTSLGRANIYDSVTASETVTGNIQLATLIYDNVQVSENLTTSLSQIEINCVLYDSISVSEQVLSAPRFLVASVYENILVGEPPQIVMTTGGQLKKRISDFIYVDL